MRTRRSIKTEDMPKLQPHQQIEGKNLALVCMPAQNQIGIAGSLVPDRRLMHKRKIERTGNMQSLNRFGARAR